MDARALTRRRPVYRRLTGTDPLGRGRAALSARTEELLPIRAGSDIAFLGGIVNHVLTEEKDFREYVLAYTNAATLTGPASQARIASAGRPETHGPGGPKATARPARDATLRHPRCVYQILKRHYASYTPELVESVCGVPRATFLRTARRRHPGTARTRLHPGLQRRPDALQPAARLSADAARPRGPRLVRHGDPYRHGFPGRDAGVLRQSPQDLLGPAVASYTAAASGMALVLGPTRENAPVRCAALLAAAAEQAATRAGGHPHALRPGAAAAALLGGRSRPAAVAGGLALLAGPACTRFGVFAAGIASAEDPAYTVGPQRARRQRRERAEPAHHGHTHQEHTHHEHTHDERDDEQ